MLAEFKKNINNIMSNLAFSFDNKDYLLEDLPTENPILLDLVGTEWLLLLVKSKITQKAEYRLIPKKHSLIPSVSERKLYLPNKIDISKLEDKEREEFETPWDKKSFDEKLKHLVRLVNQQNTLYVKGNIYPIKEKIDITVGEKKFDKFTLTHLDVDREATSVNNHYLLNFESGQDCINETIIIPKKLSNIEGVSIDALQYEELKQRHYSERYMKNLDKNMQLMEYEKFKDINAIRGRDITNREYYNRVNSALGGIGGLLGMGAGAASLYKNWGGGMNALFPAMHVASSAMGVASSISGGFERAASLRTEREMLEAENKYGIQKYGLQRDQMEEDLRRTHEIHRNEIFRATNNLTIHIANEADVNEEFWKVINPENVDTDSYGVCFINRYCEGDILQKLIDYTKAWGFDAYIAETKFNPTWTGPVQYHRIESTDIEHPESLAIIKENLLRGIYIVDDHKGSPVKTYWQDKYDKKHEELVTTTTKLIDTTKKKEAREQEIEVLKKHWEEEIKEEQERTKDLGAKWNKRYEDELERYHKLSERYRILEGDKQREEQLKKLYLDEKNKLTEEKTKLNADLQKSQKDYVDCQTEKNKLSTQVENYKKQSEIKDGQILNLQGEKNKLTQEKEGLQKDKEELTKQADNYKTQSIAKDKQIVELQGEKKNLQSSLDDLRVEKEEVDRELKAEKEAHTGTKGKHSEVSEELESKKKELETCSSNLSTALKNAEIIQKEVKENEKEINKLKVEKGKLEEDKEVLEVEKQEVEAELEALKGKHKEVEGKHTEAQGELTKVKEELTKSQRDYTECQREKNQLQSELETQKKETTNKDIQLKAKEAELNRTKAEVEKQKGLVTAETNKYHTLSESFRKKEEELTTQKNLVTLYTKQIEELKKAPKGERASTEELEKLKKDVEEKDKTIGALREIETALKKRKCRDIWNSEAFKQIKVNNGKGFVIMKKDDDKFYICMWNEKKFRWETTENDWVIKKYDGEALLTIIPRTGDPNLWPKINNFYLNSWRSYFSRNITTYTHLINEFKKNNPTQRSEWLMNYEWPIAIIPYDENFPIFLNSSKRTINYSKKNPNDNGFKLLNTSFQCGNGPFYTTEDLFNNLEEKHKILGYNDYLKALGLQVIKYDSKTMVVAHKEAAARYELQKLYGGKYKDYKVGWSSRTDLYHSDGVHIDKGVNLPAKQEEKYLNIDKGKVHFLEKKWASGNHFNNIIKKILKEKYGDRYEDCKIGTSSDNTLYQPDGIHLIENKYIDLNIKVEADSVFTIGRLNEYEEEDCPEPNYIDFENVNGEFIP